MNTYSELKEMQEDGSVENNELIEVKYKLSDEGAVTDILEEPIAENKKKRPRKRKADPEKWERNKRKKLRMSGKAYENVKRKLMPEKVHQPIEFCKCRFKCASHITTEQKKFLFEEYWNVGDACHQKAFITSLAVEHPIMRQRKRNNEKTGKEKSKSRSYFVPDAEKKKKLECVWTSSVQFLL